MTELSSANEKLRAQISEKERVISTLQLTISSLESRLSLAVARDAADRPGMPPVLAGLPTSGSDQGQDYVAETLYRITSQLIADGEELDVLGETIDEVYICNCHNFSL